MIAGQFNELVEVKREKRKGSGKREDSSRCKQGIGQGLVDRYSQFNYKKLNRKGSHILLLIFELIFVVAAAFFIFEFAIRAGSSEEVAVEMLSTEFSHMVNMLAGSSHTIQAAYPSDLSRYGLILRSDAIKVYLIPESEHQGSIERGDSEVGLRKSDVGLLFSQKQITLPTGLDASGAVEGVGEVCLRKENLLIILSECKWR